MSERPGRIQWPWRFSSVLGFGLTLGGASLIVAVLGLVRLGRQFPGAAASPRLLVPFLSPVLALSLEAGAFVALSVTALGALGPKTARNVFSWLRATSPLPLLLVAIMGLAQLVPRGTEHPGQFANQLVQSARSSCAESGSVSIPLLGLRVRCGSEQRIEGPVPGVRGASLSLQRLSFADDLRRVEMSGLELSVERSLRIQLHVQNARVAGLAPWSRSGRLSSLERFALMSSLGVALWLAAGVAPSTGEAAARAAGTVSWMLGTVVLSAIPGVVLAGWCIMLDQDRAAPAAYALPAIAAALSIWTVGWLVGRAPRFLSNFR